MLPRREIYSEIYDRFESATITVTLKIVDIAIHKAFFAEAIAVCILRDGLSRTRNDFARRTRKHCNQRKSAFRLFHRFNRLLELSAHSIPWGFQRQLLQADGVADMCQSRSKSHKHFNSRSPATGSGRVRIALCPVVRTRRISLRSTRKTTCHRGMQNCRSWHHGRGTDCVTH